MAHIAECLLDSDAEEFTLSLNNYIAKALSTQSSDDSVCNHFTITTCGWPKLTLLFFVTATARQSLAVARQAAFCLENASSRAEIPAVSHGEAAAGPPGRQVSRSRAGFCPGHGTEWREERKDQPRRRPEDTHQGAQSHPQAEGQHPRSGTHDHSSGACSGLSYATFPLS